MTPARPNAQRGGLNLSVSQAGAGTAARSVIDQQRLAGAMTRKQPATQVVALRVTRWKMGRQLLCRRGRLPPPPWLRGGCWTWKNAGATPALCRARSHSGMRFWTPPMAPVFMAP
jgi:hypothetical protein